MIRQAARSAAALTLALPLGCACHGHARPECNDFDSYPLAVPGNTPAWDSLANAAATAAPPVNELTPAQLLSECRTEWQSVVAGWSCSRAVDEYCTSHCKSDRDRAQCREGHDRYALTERCGRESIDKFVKVYPRCEGFHLCGSILTPKATACSE